jgi:hypothetical protein
VGNSLAHVERAQRRVEAAEEAVLQTASDDGRDTDGLAKPVEEAKDHLLAQRETLRRVSWSVCVCAL